MHASFLAARKKVIEPTQVNIHDEQSEARPDDQKSEASDGQIKLSWMSYPLIKPVLHHSAVSELGVIDLKSADQKPYKPD